MSARTKTWSRVPVVLAILALVGCATSSKVEVLQNELDTKNKEIEQLTMQNRQKDLEIATYRDQLDQQMKATAEAEMRAENLQMQMAASTALLPPDAKPGECYARVFIPPRYSTITENVLTQGASEKIEIIPAKYEMIEEKVLVEEASTRVETIPAQYDEVDEKVLLREAHVTWKKGRGLIEKVDNTTGEIMCLVEVPAEYKTVKKKVMIKPPSSRVINVPASYETVKIRKLVAPPQEKLVEVPAKYQTISRSEMISEGGMEWRKVLCETNMTSDMIREVQNALKNAGHDPGPIDGIMGRLTRGAINSFQQEKGLATGALTYQTIESLGIEIGK
ncbi:MAG TPA: peptidoglycan-binding protein [Deltaproteobacteria bacterium]|nr:peptidoglycan-binding protein [Deltaproteobacteria bacterium]HPR50151.1 peptidoglycan-binding protein [Deltaproteobacteria bacterium]